MGRNINTLIISLCIFLSVACTSAEQKSIDKMTKFVDNVEACASDYTADQWTVVEAQYENIRKEVDMRALDMTPDQLHAVSVQEGRFAAVVAKNYKARLKKGAESLTDYLSGFIEGFSSDEDVKGILDNIGVDTEDISAITGLLDSLDIDSIVQKLTE